jgi:tRNA nucleotidyltransferase (CCA-adding enzyme)
MQILIPRPLTTVINILQINNYEVFLIGGTIRDLIRGKTPTDFDLATTAIPNDMIKLFPNCKKTGIKFGTITVKEKCHNIEITTLRQESDYYDSRHPNTVTFCNDIYLDLKRRDFTMNAIAYDLNKKKLIDPYNGQEDIKNKLIKCTNNTKKILSEDSLRIYRAARFTSQLDFSIDTSIDKAAVELSKGLTPPSAERIHTELIKTFEGKNYKTGLLLMIRWGLLDQFFNDKQKILLEKQIHTLFDKYNIYEKISHFLLPITKKDLPQILENLRFTKKEKASVLK